MLQDMFENAAMEFQKVIKLDPTDQTAYANLTMAYEMQGMYLEEIRVLKKVLMFEPENKELRSALSTAYYNNMQFDDALGAALVVVENEPDRRSSQTFRDLQVQLEGTEHRPL